jgi:adenylate cyclase
MEMAGMKRTGIRLELLATPTIQWLLREGASANAPGVLLEGLCRRLLDEGLCIAAAALSLSSLDPMVSRKRLHWRAGVDGIIEEVLLHGMTLEPEPTDEFRVRVRGTDYEIEWSAGHADGFDDQTLIYLQTACLVLAAPLQAVVGRGVMRGLLEAYLGRRSADKVLSGAVRRGSGELIEAAIWISDLRGFTQLSELLPYDQIIAALNDCCARLVGAIHPFGGEVLKFIGDGLLAIFPLTSGRERQVCDNAIAATRAARQGMARLDADRMRLNLPPLPFGVALHLGAVVYGNIGAPDRLDFTAIGPAVNVASRIEGLCRPLGFPVLISAAVAERCSSELVRVGRHALRGAAEPLDLFTLPELAIKK